MASYQQRMLTKPQPRRGSLSSGGSRGPQTQGPSTNQSPLAAKQAENLPELPGSDPGSESISLRRRVATATRNGKAKLLGGNRDGFLDLAQQAEMGLQDVDKSARRYLQFLKKLDPSVKEELHQKEELHNIRMLLTELGYEWTTATAPLQPPKLRSTIDRVSSFRPEDLLSDRDGYQDRTTQTNETSFRPRPGPPPRSASKNAIRETADPYHLRGTTGLEEENEHNRAVDGVPRAGMSRTNELDGLESAHIDSHGNVANDSSAMNGGASLGPWPSSVDPSMAGYAGSATSAQEKEEELLGFIDGLQEEIKKRNDCINDLTDVIRIREENIDQLTDQLMESKMVTNHIIDDRELVDIWNGLIYKVAQWVSVRVKSPQLMTGEYLDHYKSMFKKLCDDPMKWIKKPEHRPLLFQALIWNQLLRHVFSQDGQLWTNAEVGPPIGLMRYMLERAVADEKLDEARYHEWRATTAILIHRVYNPAEERIRQVVADITRECCFPPLVDKRQTSPSLQEIVRDAVELDRRLVSCRANYKVYMYSRNQDMSLVTQRLEFRGIPPCGFEYVENTMEPAIQGEVYKSTKPYHKYRVALVVTPALIKYGDHEGENYKNFKLISRRMVVCEKERN